MHFQSKSRLFFRDLLQRAKRAVSLRDEMSRLDARAIQAIAHDLNLSVSELRALASAAPGSHESLGKRLMHAGLSEAALTVSSCDVLRDMQRVCGQCTSKARCAADLRRGLRAAPSSYCPNEQTLRALSVETHTRALAEILAFEPVRN
jgi:hypothetical protein